MSKIIVTGGLGFIGSNFVNYLVDNTNHDVIVVDKMTYASNINNINQEKVKLIVKDICDVKTDDLGDFDYIVHFAAESHVDNSISNGLPFVKTNVEGTFNLLEVSRKNKNLKKFIHISTDEVYGDMAEHFALNHSATETECLKPSSYYSSTKASSDMLVMSANRTYGLPYLITRTCNNYGGNQHPEKFIPKIIKSIKENIEVPVYGDGKQVREWIHVMDNVKSIYTLMMSDDINQIYNIGSGEHYKNIDLINLISQIIGKDVQFKYVPDRLGHDKKYSLNSLKFKNKFGEIKTINFKDWLKDILIK